MDGAEAPNERTRATNTPLTVFLSYAPKDALLLQHLEQHLSVLKEQGVISTWHAGQLVAGTERTGDAAAPGSGGDHRAAHQP